MGNQDENWPRPEKRSDKQWETKKGEVCFILYYRFMHTMKIVLETQTIFRRTSVPIITYDDLNKWILNFVLLQKNDFIAYILFLNFVFN